MSGIGRFDILVAGNGLVGKIAALKLAGAGFNVAMAAPAAKHEDKRTTALMVPAVQVLTNLDVWGSIASQAAPLRSMRIIDGTKNLIRARTVTFNAAEIHEEAFGWNIPNTALNSSLDEKISTTKTITRFDCAIKSYKKSPTHISAYLIDGTQLSIQLIAGADGRHSLSRDFAGVKVKSWSYPQTAFVTVFEHRLPHDDISSEFHTASGPCVQVPLPGNRSSLVWVVAPEQAEALMTQSDEQLSYDIERQLCSILGKITVGSLRQTYALSGQYAETFAQNRVTLLGEAAHVFPPIGAQGLNLGIRDVEDLCATAASNAIDPGAEAVLTQYNQKRKPDIFARVAAVNALNRSLLSTMIPAQFARAFGLALLDVAPPFRGLFMREGMRPGAGFGYMSEAFKKVVSEKWT